MEPREADIDKSDWIEIDNDQLKVADDPSVDPDLWEFSDREDRYGNDGDVWLRPIGSQVRFLSSTVVDRDNYHLVARYLFPHNEEVVIERKMGQWIVEVSIISVNP